MQYSHNNWLKEDAVASLEINHVIFKVAAHCVEVIKKQMMISIRVKLSVWQSESLIKMRDERFRLREHELLQWADIDVTVKIIWFMVSRTRLLVCESHWVNRFLIVK